MKSIKHIVLTRPKRKRFLLAWRRENEIKYLGEVLDQNKQHKWTLYEGLKGNTNNKFGSNIANLKTYLSTSNNLNLKSNQETNLVITCESFGCSRSGLAYSTYLEELQSLSAMNAYYLISTAISLDISNKDNHKNYTKLTQEIEDGKKNSNEMGLSENYECHVYKSKDVAKVFPIGQILYFNRAVLIYKGQEKQSFYKRNLDTPVLSSNNNIKEFDMSKDGEKHVNYDADPHKYINGHYISMNGGMFIENYDFYVKICNDAADLNYYLNKELELLNKSNKNKIFICTSDQLNLTDYAFLSPKYYAKVKAYNNADILIAPDPDDNGFSKIYKVLHDEPIYPWPKKLELTVNQNQADTKMISFLSGLKYIVCADSDGYCVVDDYRNQIYNLTAKLTEPYRTKLDEIPLYELYGNINLENITQDNLATQLENINLNTSYLYHECKKPNGFKLLRDTVDDLKSVRGQQLLADTFTEIGSSLNLTLNADFFENANQSYFNFFTALMDKKPKELVVHLVSPHVGNVYQVTIENNNPNKITLEQVPRINYDYKVNDNLDFAVYKRNGYDFV